MINRRKGILAAIAYLGRQKNYEVEREGGWVILRHLGRYGYDLSGNVYRVWKIRARYNYYDGLVQDEVYYE